jgi:hypothetical protein
MHIYAPIMTMALGYCITVFVEGRSGLKFPGPPTFLSGIYLTCLGIGFGFMTISTWLTFHAALRAQIACVQLRTRKIRLPVPSQRQLDSARRILSTYEEQNLYDTFRLPFVMVNGNASAPEMGTEPDRDPDPLPAGSKGKVAKGKAGSESAGEETPTKKPFQMPGLTQGYPRWVKNELNARSELPKASPSAHGMEGAPQPYEHFEYIREAQKEWWAAEAYTRVCFLYGMMHLFHGFGYWLVIHNIAELGMVWGANICAAALTSGVWLIFRLDVLPENGGCFPIEAAGPFVAAVSMSLSYTGHYTQTALNAARAIAICVLVMQILWTFRLYAIAMPSGKRPKHSSKEAGGRLFNEKGSMEVPSWLPNAFQHVTYLIAPPKTPEQLAQEEATREHGEIDDPAVKVDMTPWYYTRGMLITVIVAWFTLLAGRIVEGVMGERYILTSPGQPPWTRTGQWYGWEHGAISSKHYAHVTPQKGHWGWQRGWGPQGQQELWASDLFGFAPEADAWWAEDDGPEPLIGAAGLGENTWALGRIAYGTNEARHPDSQMYVDPEDQYPTPVQSGGGHGSDHRRLRSLRVSTESTRPVVPAAVTWPAMHEPELMACGEGSAGGRVATLTANGLGAFVPADVVAGTRAGVASNFSLSGFHEFGMARSMTWANASLHVITGSGRVVKCPVASGGKSHCEPLAVPSLPLEARGARAATLMGLVPLRAAVATSNGAGVSFFELAAGPLFSSAGWQEVGGVDVPHDTAAGEEAPEVVSITANNNYLLITTKAGVAYQWQLRDGLPIAAPLRETPTTSSGRTWWSGCSLPSGKIMRLASNTKRAADGTFAWHPELLL